MSAFTKSNLDKMIELLQETKAKNNMLSPKPVFPFGIPVIENPMLNMKPVIELSEHANVSPEFRAKCNKFYIDIFGYKEPPMMFQTQYGLIIGKDVGLAMLRH